MSTATRWDGRAFGLLALFVVVPGIKTAQLLAWPGTDQEMLRQVLELVVVLGTSAWIVGSQGTTGARLSRWLEAVGLRPLRTSPVATATGAPRTAGGWIVIGLGLAVLGTTPIADSWVRWVLVGISTFALAPVLRAEQRRRGYWRGSVFTEPPPDRAVLWATIPLWLVLLGTAIALGAIGDPTNLTVGDLLRVTLLTALGEELIFRGGMLVVAYHLFRPRGAQALAAFSFGLWHVGDAINGAPCGDGWARVLTRVVITIVITMIGGLIFTFLRHRSRTLAGPVLAHVATNLPGLAL